jgi:hypothetical protein
MYDKAQSMSLAEIDDAYGRAVKWQNERTG